MTWLTGSHKRWAIGDGLVAVLDGVPDRAALERMWREVEGRADGSVFQSWLWLGCDWAARFDRAVVLRVEQAGVVLAIGLLNRNGRFGARWLLGETGDAAGDSVFIEHNGPLVVRGRDDVRPVWFAALMRVCRGMVRLAGVGEDDVAAARAVGVVDRGVMRVAPRRDLAGLRAGGVDVLDRVSANSRQQINRALRRYGAVTVVRAGDADEAVAWLGELAVLHQATWVARGKMGAFAEPAFRRFHEALIVRGVEAGAVDVLRIAAGARVVGYLYNFVWRGVVSAYQSGFVYGVENPREKPGLVCHVAAMRYYQARGLDVYDFLGGDDRYKVSLADGAVDLHWVRVARRSSAAGVVLRVGLVVRGKWRRGG